jgi:hypothetical protein
MSLIASPLDGGMALYNDRRLELRLVIAAQTPASTPAFSC